jgi:integrase/recombinase XerD
MIEKYFKKPETWDHIRACWLFEPIDRYVRWLHDRNYAESNVQARVPLLIRFAEHARNRGAKSWAELPEHVASFVEQWVRDHAVGRQLGRARCQAANEARGPVEQMLRVVLPDFVGRGRPRHRFPFTDQVPGFLGHLQEERGVTPRTIQVYYFHLRSLESYLNRVGVAELNELSPGILSAFVTDRGQKWGKSAMIGLCASLRVFLRYAHRERLISRALSGSIQTPKRYRLATIPRSISWADVQRMLEAVDRRSANGKRDYAILLLLVTYGLRSREVAALTFDDVDWQGEKLRVPERKAGHSTAYPLSPVVGEAIVDYLKNGRPKTEERHVFIRASAPFRACGASCISIRASHYLRKAGIAVPRPGSHTLRHTCVQRLVDAQFSLKAIGDYVGHRSPDSTMIYAKVDVEALREMALGQGEEIL